ncbi:MAG TPA: MGMT family protein [Puia sp.]|jgi:methylated-DNA-protein-cysteine methyltransferase-like protein
MPRKNKTKNLQPPSKKRASPKQGTTTNPSPKVTRTRPIREQLTTVKPSGKKDDNFYDLVHEVVRQVPPGRVTTFGAIGAALGIYRSARMVGHALKTFERAEKPVPAHRVVNSIGLLSGRHHFHPPQRMQQLLEKEGVTVKDNKVMDFARHFWDPSKEL